MGKLTAKTAQRLLESAGIANEPAPQQLWLWVGLSGMALGCAVTAWPGNRWTLSQLVCARIVSAY